MVNEIHGYTHRSISDYSSSVKIKNDPPGSLIELKMSPPVHYFSDGQKLAALTHVIAELESQGQIEAANLLKPTLEDLVSRLGHFFSEVNRNFPQNKTFNPNI